MKWTKEQASTGTDERSGRVSSRTMTTIAAVLLIASVALPAQVQGHVSKGAWESGLHEYGSVSSSFVADSNHCDTLYGESPEATQSRFCDQKGSQDETDIIRVGFAYAAPVELGSLESVVELHQFCDYEITKAPAKVTPQTNITQEAFDPQKRTVCDDHTVSEGGNLSVEYSEHASWEQTGKRVSTTPLRMNATAGNAYDFSEFTLAFVTAYVGTQASTLISSTYDDFHWDIKSGADEYHIADPDGNDDLLVDGNLAISSTQSSSIERVETEEFTYERIDWTYYRDCCVSTDSPNWDTSRMDSDSYVWVVTHKDGESFAAEIQDDSNSRDTIVEEYSI